MFCHRSSLSFHLRFLGGACSVLSSENGSCCSHWYLTPKKSGYQSLSKRNAVNSVWKMRVFPRDLPQHWITLVGNRGLLACSWNGYVWGEDLAGSTPACTCVLQDWPVLCLLGIPTPPYQPASPRLPCPRHGRSSGMEGSPSQEGRAGTCGGCCTLLGIACLTEHSSSSWCVCCQSYRSSLISYTPAAYAE